MKWAVEKPTRLFDLLREKFPEKSNTGLRKLLKHGWVQVDGRPEVRADMMAPAGTVLELRKPQIMPETGLEFPVLLEDPDLIAVDKPAGLLCISTDEEKVHTLYAAVTAYVRRSSAGRDRIFIVHRLDREVSGVVLFAKTFSAKETLQKNWTETEKFYYAVVEGTPPAASGTIQSRLLENQAFNVYATTVPGEGKTAITHYRILAQERQGCLLEIRIETGRKHQIRVHLANLGCPIVGDRRYGAKTNPFRRMALHAQSLSFNHPVNGQRLTLVAPLPDFMAQMMKT